MVISMAVVYVPEHWHLASFTKTSFVINPAREKEDTQGMISMTRLHKKAQFYPDVSYGEYKQHMTLLTLPVEEGLELCCVVGDFAVGALHRQPERFCKNGGLASWAPPAFRKAPAGKLQMITRFSSKTWEVQAPCKNAMK